MFENKLWTCCPFSYIHYTFPKNKNILFTRLNISILIKIRKFALKLYYYLTCRLYSTFINCYL